MGVEKLLPLLNGVKATGKDRWICRCPAHVDKSPSMTIREMPDGRVLIHCFAGCDTEWILNAMGLEFSDLFPEPLTQERFPRIHAPFNALEALQCLKTESAIVAFAASDVALGVPLSARDADRVATAAGRIASALEASHGQ